MKFFIETIGCQQNEYDASRLAIFLKSAGFVETQAREVEVIFILACSVRQTAVDRIFGRIKNWKDKKIIVTSCLTPGDQKKITDKGVYYWNFGDTKQLEKILNISLNNETMNQCSNSVYIPIMSGCNNFCSYCIVPHTRGREKSRPMEEIIAEVKNLISHFRTAQYGSEKSEIVLLGQNVNSYKSQISNLKSQNYNSKLKNEKTDFARLLERLNSLPGDFTISFMSNHPKDMTEDVIEAIATLPKVKKQIHLPLQSGSDRILKLMNRPYTARQYLDIIKDLRLKIPAQGGSALCGKDLKITTDVIVGFPGETEEDFQQTVKVFKQVGFSQAYINKYSPRSGTKAYNLGDPISWEEKKRRWRILNEIANK